MNNLTGARIEGDEYLAQQVADVLVTPIGSRLMRRDYGSLLIELLDHPFNSETRLLCYAAIAGALRRGIARLTLTRCVITRTDDGQGEITIEGKRNDVPAANAFTRLTLPLPLLN